MILNTKTIKKDYSGYIYILPATIFILLFSISPICMSFYYSFNKFNIVQPMNWVGLNNYINLFRDTYVNASIRNTIVYALLVVPSTTVLSIVIAALITSRRKNAWNGFVKSSLFIPVISSMILVGNLWRIMYNPQSGLINQFLNLLGISSINWLGSNRLALVSVCIVGVWKNVGYFMVIYIASILDIPRELYEASHVDGASKLQQFRLITLPMLRNITFLVVTLCTIWSFQVFDLVYTMTGGGPGKATVTLVSTIYNAAFREYKMGYACAMAILLFAIIVVISSVQQLLHNRYKDS